MKRSSRAGADTPFDENSVRKLEFLSELPAARIAEIEAWISWPAVSQSCERERYLANHIKNSIIASIEDVIVSSDAISLDDAIKGLYLTTLVHERDLFESLGGIRSIMNSNMIENSNIESMSKRNYVVGLCVYLMYCGYNYESLFSGKFKTQNSVLDLFYDEYQREKWYINVRPSTLKQYLNQKNDVLHLAGGLFVYNETLRLFDGGEIYDNVESRSKWRKDFIDNKFRYISGYAKTIYDWGIKQEVFRSPKNKVINRLTAVRNHCDMCHEELPFELAKHFSYLVHREPVKKSAKWRVVPD